jgi:hypothetical protein
MKTPPDLAAIVRVFTEVPVLAGAGVLAGATALHHEHLENRLGRFSFDIDLQTSAEDLESVHRRLGSAPALRLLSRLNEGLYQYEARAGRRVVRVELAKPYLRHRSGYAPSRHVPGLAVVALADLLFAKVSAFSTRGFPRDFIDLYAVNTERRIDWEKLLRTAARAADNDYSPSEFAARMSESVQAIRDGGFFEELPVRRPPSSDALSRFADILAEANARSARALLGH